VSPASATWFAGLADHAGAGAALASINGVDPPRIGAVDGGADARREDA